MTNQKSDKLEELRLFVANLMNEEQDKHSDLINRLKVALADTREWEDTYQVLHKIQNEKVKLLEKIYDKIQEIQC